MELKFGVEMELPYFQVYRNIPVQTDYATPVGYKAFSSVYTYVSEKRSRPPGSPAKSTGPKFNFQF
jgi:hypothetical protein